MPALRDSRISFPDPSEGVDPFAPSDPADASGVKGVKGDRAPDSQEFSLDSFLELGEDATPPPPEVELVVRRSPYPGGVAAVAAPVTSVNEVAGPPRSRPRSSPPPLPSSLAPVAADTADTAGRAPFHVPTIASSPPPRPKPRSPWPLAVAIVAAGVAAAAFVLRFAPQVTSSVANAVTSAPAAFVAPAAPPPAQAEPTSEPSPIGPPPRPVGTVVGAEGHRLWVDGRLMSDWRAEVDCGEHVVQVGSAGTPRSVDVRCDSEVIVSP